MNRRGFLKGLISSPMILTFETYRPYWGRPTIELTDKEPVFIENNILTQYSDLVDPEVFMGDYTHHYTSDLHKNLEEAIQEMFRSEIKTAKKLGIEV